MSLYVSNNGNDNNTADGSISNPYKTLTYALTQLNTQKKIFFFRRFISYTHYRHKYRWINYTTT